MNKAKVGGLQKELARMPALVETLEKRLKKAAKEKKALEAQVAETKEALAALRTTADRAAANQANATALPERRRKPSSSRRNSGSERTPELRLRICMEPDA